ncbi:GNAT family N-acetyltransferase [Nonomuraea sp. NPDC049607]|uniref:GNAT family N-acetyltransferase n=1 Tax=Nonomuraea sp. NPDC049607 TaxID=3154732 RepID=UPI003444B2BF
MSAPAFRIEPASADRFDDVSTMLAPRRPGTTACWCLSHRIDPAVNRELGPDQRPGYMRRLCRQPVAPGVLAYDVDEVVGWAGVAPRAEVYSVARNSRIPKIGDDLAIWSIWCLKVRAGHRGRGVARALIDGAVRFAREHGAAAVEGYPVDNDGKKIDTMLAFVGTRSLFESAGFVKIADTGSTAAGVPRIVMRLGG